MDFSELPDQNVNDSINIAGFPVAYGSVDGVIRLLFTAGRGAKIVKISRCASA